MGQPEGPQNRGIMAYQGAILGISAIVIVLITMSVIGGLRSLVGDPGSLAVGVTAAGQVLGASAPRGPSPASLPGLVGTVTPSETSTRTPTRVPTVTPTLSPTVTPTLTPDVRSYDPARAKTLLAQAQTSWGSESPAFLANVALAADKINGRQIAPGGAFSFNTVAGPYDTFAGYRVTTAGHTAVVSDTVSIVDGGITQVSTTLFQAVFWSGLKIVERQPHPTWLDRFSAGSTSQRGLDAFVNYGTTDFRFQNNSDDWIRVDATVQPGNVTVSIFGADPGWSVDPIVGSPSKTVQPNATPVLRPDPEMPSGQQISISPALVGFDVAIQRTVTRNGAVLDRYGVAEHYQPQPAIIAVGPAPTVTATAVVTPTAVVAPNPTQPVQSGPTRLAGLNPSLFVLADGRIRVPTLTGLSESEAQQVIIAVGLATTYPNLQGPGDVPSAILNSVDVGQVLSQNPLAGSAAAKGATVYLAVRKQ